MKIKLNANLFTLMGTSRPHSSLPTVIVKAMLLLAFALGGDAVFAQIALRGSATTASTTTTSLTINKPTGVVAGDVMIVNISQLGNSATDPTSSGWTVIQGAAIQTSGGASAARRGAILYRVAGGTESSSYTFTLGTGVSAAIGNIVAFSGVGASTFDAASPAISVANSASVSATSLSTVSANAAVIMFGQAAANPTWSSWSTATAPGTLTELYDNQNTNVSVGAAWAIMSAAGATGAGAATLSASQRNGGVLVALRPCAVNAASSTPSVCINTAMTSITHTTTGYTGIGTPTGLPSGVTAAFASNTITISGTPSAAGTFNYSIPVTGGCGASATGTITVLNSSISYANLQFPATQTICAGSNFTAYGQLYEAGVTESAGANATIAVEIGYNSSNTNPSTWSAGNWSAATWNVQSGNNDEYQASLGSSLSAGTYYYTFRYRRNGCAWVYGGYSSGGGGTWNGTTNISGVLTVNANNTITLTSAAGTNTQTRCNGVAITNITYSTTGATGATITGLPTGVTGTWASNAITISGTPTANGTFNYTVTMTGGCTGGTNTATGSITVQDGSIGYANLQFPATQSVCVGNNFTAFGRVYAAGATEAAGSNAAITAQIGFSTSNTDPSTWPSGNWSAATWNVQSGNNDEYQASLGASLAVGTYYYTFRYSRNSCSWVYGGFSSTGGSAWDGTTNISGVLTVNANNTIALSSAAGTNAQTRCNGAAITNITYSTTGATGATATGLPSGVTGLWAANIFTISGTPTSNGTFNYTVTLTGGCTGGTNTATGSIVVTANNTITLTSAAGTNNQQTCQNGAIAPITYATTGATGATFSGLPTGVSGSWASNVVTISGSPSVSGTFNYTVTLTGGCTGGTNSASGTLSVTAASAIYSHNFNDLGNSNTSFTSNPAYTTPAGVFAQGLSSSVWSATSGGAAASFSRSAGATGYGIAFNPGSNQTSTLTLTFALYPGYELSINSFNLWRYTQTAGAPSISSITINGTSVFGGETSPTTGASLGTTCVSNPVNNLTGNVTVTINLTASSVAGGNRWFYMDDFVLNGTVTSSNPYSEVYLHNFNSAPNGSPYTVSPTASTGNPPGIFNSNFIANSSSWTSSTGTMTNVNDANGGNELALLTPAGATSSLTLQFSVACGYVLNINALNFFQQRQTTASSNISSITINGVQVYGGSTAPTTGAYIGVTAVSTPLTEIAGDVTVVINLTASNETAGNRYFYLDDFTLFGTVVANTNVPAQPDVISGTISPCPSTTGLTYTIAPVSNSTSYSWTVPTGWSITAGAGTTSITVTSGAAGQTGNISVAAVNCIGAGPARTLAVTLNPATPAQPGVVSGLAAQCPATANQTYSVVAVANATTYNWSVPTGWSITSGAGTNSITVTTGSTGQNGNISVSAQNSCGTSAIRTFAVTLNAPAQPGTISGTTPQCPGLTGQVYSIAAVANATTYNWNVPTGWTITAGAGTASITVTTGSAGQNGNISVTSQNCNGTSSVRTLAVTVSAAAPAQPASITGLAAQCPVVNGQTYSVAAVANATSYAWVVPTGWSITAGAGTNSITVSTGSAGQNGAVRVAASNSCGTSAITNYAVVVNARPTAVTSGSDLICFGNSATIDLSFSGNGPFTGTLSNGQSFSASGNNANVTVAPSVTTTYTISTLNDANCAAVGGLTGSAVVTVNPLPTATITGSAVVCAGNTASLTVTGPANGEVAYTRNGVQDEVNLNASGTATINTGNVWQNLNYTLVEVEDGVCNNTLSGTATITVQELPDATITGSTQLCAGQSTTVAFNGNANAVVTYNVNGGSNQNVTLNASGNGTINTGALNTTTTYNLVSVASNGCSASIGTSAVVNVGLSIFYQDNDGDGYGNSSVSTVACTQPAGYVAVGGDCCDNNANINPVCEWWGDMDGDGYGSFVYDVGCIAGVGCSNTTWPAQLIPYCPLANYGVLYSQDCNDFSTAVSPAASEICNNTIDDDCDGIIGDGCSGQFFDQWATAQLLNVNNINAVYPNCQTYSGTMVNTDISSEGNPANVAVGGGRDVWYKFVAPTTGVRIKVTANAFNPVIELRTSAYAPGPNGNAGQVDVENVNPAIGGMEILNNGNLVVGQTYYVGIRNYDATNVGTYTICVSPLRQSGCAYAVPAGGFSLCNSYKADYTAASSYTFNFTGISGVASGNINSATINSNLISLSNPALGVLNGSGYNVRIDANYTLTDGLGQLDGTITVMGNANAGNCQNVLVMQQPLVAVQSSQVCPATLLRSSYLMATTVNGLDKLCGVVNYTFEFTRVTDCTGTTVIGTPFTANSTGAAASVLLSSVFTSQQANTGYWMVRVRPNFANNVSGTYGPYKVISVNGTAASQMLDEAANENQNKTLETQPLSVVYPNPNNGNEVNINLSDVGSGELSVKIMDALGRIIYSNRYTVDGSLFTNINFAEQLTGGIYLVEFTINGETMNERMIVER